MSRRQELLIAFLAGLTLLLGPRGAYSEAPLPSATVFGRIVTRDGQRVSAGALRATVARGGGEVLTVDGEFVESNGQSFYVLRVPMETAIGAPGESGAARRGDVLRSLTVDGEAVSPALSLTLEEGLVSEFDGVVDSVEPPVVRLSRGDCNGDGSYEISDPVSVLLFLFQGGARPGCERACDANADRAVNLSDAIFMLQNLFTGGPSPLPPFKTCGVDDLPSPIPCERPCN